MNTSIPSPETRSAPRLSIAVFRDALLAGVAAAISTTLVAALGTAADVSLTIDSKQIPLSAFPFWTIIGAALGVGIAAITRTRGRFITATVTGTLLSLIPALVLPDDNTTRMVLALAHLAAAAVIIPAIARHAQPTTSA